jgi:hypothetical protein
MTWRMQTDSGRVRMRWEREDGVWMEIREETDEVCWLVDKTGLSQRFENFTTALDAAYRRQAELDNYR